MICEICSRENVLRYNHIGWLCPECVKNFKMECTKKELEKYASFSKDINTILFGYGMGFSAGQSYGRQQESDDIVKNHGEPIRMLWDFTSKMHSLSRQAHKMGNCFAEIGNEILKELQTNDDDLRTDGELHPENRFRKEIT